jgi:hypothetical protein
VQLVLPVVDTNRPDVHAEQYIVPVWVVNLPTEQLLHMEALRQYICFPYGHDVQWVLPVSAVNVPEEHLWHSVFPVVFVYFPAVQLSQTEDPVLD